MPEERRKNPMTTSSVRMSTLKICGLTPDLRRDLALTHLRVNHAAGDLMRWLLVFRGEPCMIRGRGGDVPFDAGAIAAWRRSMTPRKKGRDAAIDLVGESLLKEMARGFLSPLLRADSRTGTSARGEDGPSAGKLATRVLLEMGAIPLRDPDSGVPVFRKHAMPMKFWYAAWANAVARFRSWVKCNDRTKAEYAKRRTKAEDLEAQYAGQAAGIRGGLDEWFRRCEGTNLRPNGKLLDRWRWTIRPAFLRGDVPDVPYDPALLAELRDSLPGAWEDFDLVSLGIGAIRARRKLLYTAATAAVSLPDPHESPSWMCFGTNYSPFTLQADEGRFLVKFDLLDHRNPGASRPHAVRTHRSQYFLDPQVRGAEVPFEIAFTKGNRRAERVEGAVKEIGLEFDRGTLSRVRGPAFEGGQFGEVAYVRIPFHVAHAQSPPPYDDVRVLPKRAKSGPDDTGNDYAPLQRAVAYFGTAIGSTTEKTESNRAAVRVGLRTLSIDLNLAPLGSWSLYELCEGSAEDGGDPTSFDVPGIGHAAAVDSGVLGPVANPRFCASIAAFRGRIRKLREAIDRYRGLYRASPGAAALSPALRAARAPICEEVAALKGHFSRLCYDPTRQRGVAADHFRFLFAAKEWTQCIKSWGTAHRPEEPPGARRHSGEFASYFRHVRNAKGDLLKKLAARIAELAEALSAHVVLIEDFSFYRPSESRDRSENGMLALWSTGQLADFLVGTLAAKGVAVEAIDPRYSSQVDPFTDEFGGLGGPSKKRLHVFDGRGGKAVVDADDSAAVFLQRRFWTRYSGAYALPCRRVRGARGLGPVAWVPILDSKRLQGALQARYGSKWVVLRGTGDGKVFEALPITAPRHAALQKAQDTEFDRLYRHGDEWVAWKEHVARQRSLVAMKINA